jgi:hypothetical protein
MSSLFCLTDVQRWDLNYGLPCSWPTCPHWTPPEYLVYSIFSILESGNNFLKVSLARKIFVLKRKSLDEQIRPFKSCSVTGLMGVRIDLSSGEYL